LSGLRFSNKNVVFVRKPSFSSFFILFHPFSKKKDEKGRKRQKKAEKGRKRQGQVTVPGYKRNG